MAKPTLEIILGIDVSKATLDICEDQSNTLIQIDNDRVAIAQWLSGQSQPLVVALEATNHFHEEVVLQLIQAGHQVFLVDGYRASKYREATGGRAKTDQCDAILLARFLRAERQYLRPATLLSPQLKRFFRLLRYRALITKTLTAITQSMRDLGIDDPAQVNWLKQGKANRKQIDKQLLELSRQMGWQEDTQRCQSVPGIGILNALALTAQMHRGHFKSADAFVAYLGLDVRVRQSGNYRGRSKLSKKGDPEIRRLLFNAAMAARRDPRWKTYYQRQIAKGLSTTAALVILARKLVRVCFALVKNQTEYDPNLTGRSCQAT